MKKLLIFTEIITLIFGTYIFIYSTLDNYLDVEAGLGGAILFTSLIIRELRISSFKLRAIRKVIILITGFIGTWLFITNTLDSKELEASLGGTLFILSLYLMNFNNELSSQKNTLINLRIGVLFIVMFMIYSVSRNEINSVDSTVTSLKRKIDEIEINVYGLDSKLEKIEKNSHYHNY